MTWRPTEFLIEGELDNTTPGRIAGWMRFAGMDNKVALDLAAISAATFEERESSLRGRTAVTKLTPGRG